MFSQLFGQHVEVDHGELPQIRAWKQLADEKSEEHRRKLEELAAVNREKELRDFVALKDYVNERSKVFRRRQLQMQHLAEQEECDRVQQRLNDRAVRRALRFERSLEAERALMAYEDGRSYTVRFFNWEQTQILREQEDMLFAEAEQCEVGDRFWGLDLYVRNRNAEEQRLKRAYENRVLDVNRTLHAVKATAPLCSRRNRSNGRMGGQRQGQVTIRRDQLLWREEAFPSATAANDRVLLARQRGQTSSQQGRIGHQETGDGDALLKALKAEEVRGKLKYRISPGYS